MSKSIEWVTTLKFFGIIAVILGHIASPLGGFIYSWHMPLFFMIAGFFIKIEANLKDLIIKDWKRLMIPYFIFAILALAITSLKHWGLHRDPLSYLDELNAIFLWMDYKHLINTYAFALWFLPALFVAKFVYYIIKKNVSNLLLQYCVFTFIFWGSFYIPLELPFALNNAMNSVLWLFMGSQLFSVLNRDSKVERNRYFRVFTFLVPVALIATIYVYGGVPKLDMSSLTYGHKIINVLWAVSLFILFALFLKYLPERLKAGGLVEQWGGATMLLFILHPYTNNISHLLVEKVNFGSWPLKLLISLCLLQLILILKKRFSNRWIFKYV